MLNLILFGAHGLMYHIFVSFCSLFPLAAMEAFHSRADYSTSFNKLFVLYTLDLYDTFDTIDCN